jgi:pyridoxine 5-phosphate synthase
VITPIRLGVNIDHIATIREARGTRYPDPVQAGFIAVDAGADGITVHLREDRRHIQERDVHLLRDSLTVPLNLEMAATPEMVEFAREVRPAKCCIVPEKRQELTTEGGLDVCSGREILTRICAELSEADIEVSLFIDPDRAQIEAAAAIGVPVVELHTGTYAEEEDPRIESTEFARISTAARIAAEASLQVNAGHGLNYHNVAAIVSVPEIVELNIGHAIVARALFGGLTGAVRDMKRVMQEARR